MATSGAAAFNKYFADKKLETVTKYAGSLYDPSGKTVVGKLAENVKITVLPTKTYNENKIGASILLPIYLNGKMYRYPFNNIAKPIQKSGATEILRIQATTLIRGGKREIVQIGGVDVECYTFRNSAELKKSILAGLMTNPRVTERPEFLEAVKPYLAITNKDYSKIKWNGEIQNQPSLINEFGKYIGELIVGMIAFDGAKDPGIRAATSGKRVVKFIVPSDSTYKGIDTLVELVDGTMVPFSSKLGVGARASFFGNVFPYTMKTAKLNKNSLKVSVLRDLAEAARNVNIDASTADKNGKKVVYEYGIKNILKLKIANTYGVYENIARGMLKDKDVMAVVTAIANDKTVDPRIKAALPQSVTSFFSRTIADRLNNDKISLDEMIRIIAGKEFWQANLNLLKLGRGTIEYKTLKSGHAKLKMIGNKAAINDLKAGQGLINYELKY